MHAPTPTTLSAGPRVRQVGWTRPLQWLSHGMADLVRAPVPGLLHGLACTLFGLALVALAREHFWALAGAFSGFLIVAPLVATGLYEVSRRLARGERPRLTHVAAVWRSLDARLVRFGLLLALAGTGWVFTSAAMITGLSSAHVGSPADFLHLVVLDERSWLFEAWTMLGALLAAPVFASSVVALPMLLDRPVGVMTAVLTSWRAVMASPAALAIWALLIVVLTAIGMAALMLGLLVAAPWLGHASWHAYDDLVAPEDVAPQRTR